MSVEGVDSGIAHMPNMSEYSHTNYTSAEYPLVSSTPLSVADQDATSIVHTDTGAYTLSDSSVIGGGITYTADGNVQEAPDGLKSDNHHEETVNQENSTNIAVPSANYGATDSSCATENGSILCMSATEQPIDTAALSAEEEKLWSIVRANGLDFNAWTALLQETEKVAQDNIIRIRRVYDAFLVEFPLCYGYWKKYADHEARLGTFEKIVEVYERAVLAVTYSVDIWLHYCIFAMVTYDDPDTIRRLFERGLAYVGSDYLSAPLWDKYIEYEYTRQEWSHLAIIYTRILENPIQQLDRYYGSFKELAMHRPLSEIQTAEEAALVASMEAGGANESVAADDAGHSEHTSPQSVSAGLAEAKQLERYIAIRDEMYKKAKEFDSKIIDFEAAIRRPYFHVRPLDEAQLENWHNYLDFVECVDDFNKVVKLYERCLIACANYPAYWMRYVNCMEASGSLELANNALARATQVFVKRQPEIHLFASRFKEHNGDVAGARAHYEFLHSELSPGLLEAVVRHANMEFRLGNIEAAYNVYEGAITVERGKEQSQVLPLLLAQYWRFLFTVAGNIEKAKEISDGAFEHVPLSKSLLEAVIHLEALMPSPKRLEYLDSLVERFIIPDASGANPSSSAEREDLSLIFLEFLDHYGESMLIKKAEIRHMKLFLSQKTTMESRKRHAEDFIASEKAKLVKYTGVPSAVQSVMGAYPGLQGQWAGGYVSQPQVWSQAASQGQGQQWNAGYTQQGAYGGYAAYGGYQHPQIPTSTSQMVAYGAYPPYSSQALPQQTYSQPTAASQPQPVAQSYYGSYY